MKKFLCSCLGAFLFSIPWLLVYLFFNYLVGYLAFLIVYGGLLFYLKAGGEKNTKSMIMIGIISILVVTIEEFLIMPTLLFLKEGYGFDLNYFITAYSDSTVMSAMIHDYLISLLFVGVGFLLFRHNSIGGASGTTNLNDEKYKDRLSEVEKAYAKYNAFSKETAISEFKIMKELNFKNKIGFMLLLEQNGVVVAPFIKSYYDKDALTNKEKSTANKNKTSKIIAIVLVAIVCVLFAVGIVIFNFEDNGGFTSNTSEVETTKYSLKSLSINLSSKFYLYEKNDDYLEFYTDDTYSIVKGIYLDYYDNDSFNMDFVTYYDNYLNENCNIYIKFNKKIDDIDFIGYVTNSKEYPNEYYIIYINSEALDANYAITFYNNYVDSNNVDYDAFIKACDKYLENIIISNEDGETV